MVDKDRLSIRGIVHEWAGGSSQYDKYSLRSLMANVGPGGGGETQVVIQPPEIFNYAGTNVFRLYRNPAYVVEVLVLDGDKTLHYLKTEDYAVNQDQVMVYQPLLSAGMQIKITYAA